MKATERCAIANIGQWQIWLLILVTIAWAGCDQRAQAPESLLFVQNAQRESHYKKDTGTLTLFGVGSTLVFSDRPFRESNYVSSEEFAAQGWSSQIEGSFFADPPNAVLVYHENGETKSIVLILVNGWSFDGVTQYHVTDLEGKIPELPEELNGASLFIDSWWHHIKSWAKKSYQKVHTAVVHAVDNLTTCVGLTSPLLTVALTAAIGGEVTAAKVATGVLKSTAINAISELACDAIHDSGVSDASKINVDTCTRVLAAALRTAVNPIGEIAHVGACLICGKPVN